MCFEKEVWDVRVTGSLMYTEPVLRGEATHSPRVKGPAWRCTSPRLSEDEASLAV